MNNNNIYNIIWSFNRWIARISESINNYRLPSIELLCFTTYSEFCHTNPWCHSWCHPTEGRRGRNENSSNNNSRTVPGRMYNITGWSIHYFPIQMLQKQKVVALYCILHLLTLSISNSRASDLSKTCQKFHAHSISQQSLKTFVCVVNRISSLTPWTIIKSLMDVLSPLDHAVCTCVYVHLYICSRTIMVYFRL